MEDIDLYVTIAEIAGIVARLHAASTPPEQLTPAQRMALRLVARGNRYAGSKDRAAIRDHVFEVLRQWRSTAWVGGGDTGRARMLGALRLGGVDPDTLFTGEGYAPPPLDADERAAGRALGDAPEGVRLDWPDWLMAETRRRAAEREGLWLEPEIRLWGFQSDELDSVGAPS